MPRAAKSTRRARSPKTAPRKAVRKASRGRFPWGLVLQATVVLAVFGTLLYSIADYVSQPRPGSRVYRLPAAPAVAEYIPARPDSQVWNAFLFSDEAHRLIALPFATVLYHRQDWGGLQVDHNVAGGVLRIGRHTFRHGIGTHANSEIRLRFEGKRGRLIGKCGVDGSAGPGSEMTFSIAAGRRSLFDSGPFHFGDEPRDFAVPLEHGDLTLSVTAPDVIAGHWADWVELRVEK